MLLNTKKFLAIEIGGTKLQMVTGNGEGNLFTTHRFDVRKEKGAAGTCSNKSNTGSISTRCKIYFPSFPSLKIPSKST